MNVLPLIMMSRKTMTLKLFKIRLLNVVKNLLLFLIAILLLRTQWTIILYFTTLCEHLCEIVWIFFIFKVVISNFEINAPL